VASTHRPLHRRIEGRPVDVRRRLHRHPLCAGRHGRARLAAGRGLPGWCGAGRRPAGASGDFRHLHRLCGRRLGGRAGGHCRNFPARLRLLDGAVQAPGGRGREPGLAPPPGRRGGSCRRRHRGHFASTGLDHGPLGALAMDRRSDLYRRVDRHLADQAALDADPHPGRSGSR
ncbi:hypothetical protein LTR94_032191, partial [Friedmanniomyces endolithicus]